MATYDLTGSGASLSTGSGVIRRDAVLHGAAASISSGSADLHVCTGLRVTATELRSDVAGKVIRITDAGILVDVGGATARITDFGLRVEGMHRRPINVTEETARVELVGATLRLSEVLIRAETNVVRPLGLQNCWEFYLMDSYGVVQTLLADAKEKAYYAQLGGPGSGSFKIHLDAPHASEIAVDSLILVRYRNRDIGAFVVETIDRPAICPQERSNCYLSVSGRGLMALFEHALVYPSDLSKPSTATRSFSGKTRASIFLTLYNEALNRGVHLPSADFTAEQDSAHATWDDSNDLEYKAGATLLDVIKNHAGLGTDIYMTPDFTLHYRKRAGSDISDTVRMVEGRDITCGKFLDDGKSLATAILAEGKDLFVEKTDASGLANYGRREGYLSTQNSVTTDQADAAAGLLLASTKQPARAIGLTVRPETFFPFIDYGLGDYIYIDAPSLTAGAYRVLSISVKEGQGPCDLYIGLELHNRAFDFLTQLNAQFQALQQNRSQGRAATSGLSSGSTAPAGNATQIQGRAVASTAPSDGDGLIWNDSSGEWEPSASAGGGASAFTDLTDTPPAYSGKEYLPVAVKSDASGLEFARPILTVWNYRDSNRSSSGYAWKGNHVFPSQDIIIFGLAFYGSVVEGATYQGAIVTLDSGKIATITKTAAVTLPPSLQKTDGNVIWLYFSEPQLLQSGGDYYLVVGRTDGSDTYALPVSFDANTTYQRLPIPAAQDNSYIRIAKANPAVGDAVNASCCNQVGMGVIFTV